MSTQTEHLGLHQWEAGDSFLRSDFNEDFAKIDQAVGVLRGRTDVMEVSGTYTPPVDTAVEIKLGFRPRILSLVCTTTGGGSTYHNTLLKTCGFCICFSYRNNAIMPEIYRENSVAFTDGGFTIPAKGCIFNMDKSTVVSYHACR